MKVLIACERFGVIRDAFIKAEKADFLSANGAVLMKLHNAHPATILLCLGHMLTKRQCAKLEAMSCQK